MIEIIISLLYITDYWNYKDLSLYKFTLERIISPIDLQSMKLKQMPGFRLKWKYEYYNDGNIEHIIQPEPRYTSRIRTTNLIR